VAIEPVDDALRQLVVSADQLPPASRAKPDGLRRGVNDVRHQDRLQGAAPAAWLRRAVTAHRLEVDRDPRLVADDPSVVTRWELEDITGPDLELDAIAHLDAKPAAECHTDVVELATLGARNRLDLDRPPPAWLVCHPADDAVVELDDVDSAARNHANVVRLRELPTLQSRHWSLRGT